MDHQTSPSVPGRASLRRPEVRAAAASALAVLLIVAVLAVADPSGGFLAPVGGHGLPLVAGGAAFRWSGLVAGLPVLVAASALPVLALARAGRPVVRARFVLVLAWVTAGGAGALGAAAAGFVTALPLVGPHLALGAAARYALLTSGFAGAKLLALGWLVGGGAAIAYRVGPQPADVDAAPRASTTRLTVVTVLVVAALAAVTSAAQSWRGGPLGYAFTGFLVAPSAGAGTLGAVTGLAVFVGAFAACARAVDRRVRGRVRPWTVAAGVWFGGVAAGLALAVVDALLAALPGSARLADAGPDSWWIATSLLSLAAGLAYGVTIGSVAAVVAAGAWWWRARRAAAPAAAAPAAAASRRPRRGAVVVGAVVALAVVLVPLGVGAPAPAQPPVAAPEAPGAGLARLRLVPAATSGGLPTIGDATGREVILRGVDVNQLVDYYLRDPSVPANGALTDDDFAQMAALGFDVARLAVSWSRLEPTRGHVDEAYLDQVRTAVHQAAAHGIYTVLDMHEDAWGNALAAPHQSCGGGTTPTTGYDGAPAWATITDGTLHCQFLARDLAPATATAFSNFYADRDGIQSELVHVWGEVARAFAGDPAVAGYDLLNEPGIGATPPVSSGLLLGRYYAAAISEIRDAERQAGGFPHLVFFEPSVLWSGLGFDATPPPGFTQDRELVFAPHPYSESITMDQGFGLTIASIERNLAVSSRAAAAYGAALWAGEWGWFGEPAADRPKLERFVDEQDRLRVGGAFWVWRQGCGAPETAADATSSGNFVPVDCATGELGAPPADRAEPLSRAYPRAAPGRLTAIRPGDDGSLAVTGTVDGAAARCGLDVWVPGDDRPLVHATGLTAEAVEQVPGGWRVTGCGRGDYTVTITS